MLTLKLHVWHWNHDELNFNVFMNHWTQFLLQISHILTRPTAFIYPQSHQPWNEFLWIKLTMCVCCRPRWASWRGICRRRSRRRSRRTSSQTPPACVPPSPVSRSWRSPTEPLLWYLLLVCVNVQDLRLPYVVSIDFWQYKVEGVCVWTCYNLLFMWFSCEIWYYNNLNSSSQLMM